MSELGPEARALFDAARAEEAPTAADRARVRSALTRALAASGAAAATAASAKGAAASATAKATSSVMGVVGKAMVSIALVGAVTAGVSVGLRAALSTSAAPPAASAAPGESPRPIAAPGRTDRTDVPVEPSGSSTAVFAPPPTGAASISSASRPVPERADPAKLWPASGGNESAGPRTPPEGRTANADPRPIPEIAGVAAPTATPTAEDALEIETRHLGEAYRELQSGNPTRALSLLDQQSTVHAGGELGEERAVARLVALCKLGRAVEAKAAADRFLREHPRSPHADRVRAGCSAPKAP